MVRGLERCRALLKVGEARVGDGASASVQGVLTWTEQGASHAGGQAAWSPHGPGSPQQPQGRGSRLVLCSLLLPGLWGCGHRPRARPGNRASGVRGLLEASEASQESGPGMRVLCGCQVRPQPNPLSCGQQSRRGEETQLELAWREEDRRQGSSQRHWEDRRQEDRRRGGSQRCREDREAGGTAHLQSDRREATRPGQRPHRGLGILLRPRVPLPPGAGWAPH